MPAAGTIGVGLHLTHLLSRRAALFGCHLLPSPIVVEQALTLLGRQLLEMLIAPENLIASVRR